MVTETRPIYMLPRWESLQIKRHTKIENENIPCKKKFHVNGNFKNVGGSILIWDKIDTETKTVNKRQRRALHNDKQSNPTIKYNCKYICTHQSTT